MHHDQKHFHMEWVLLFNTLIKQESVDILYITIFIKSVSVKPNIIFCFQIMTVEHFTTA